ncbi:TetR/AcrR family transcriptional regulator [Nocardia donostiensis]|uniref:TetR family transcriptional regulator n=1 Tax=Nocardia donostiensis TaxID=1538463 RepID=A0A1V2TIN9_9NOCA|nr:TetR/AcrR family transcriptional regulator [Nocardia donostiensis]ONM49323.1 TetR family transcriptional regulator [Nocardia donostiensis]OQS21846.1 TetR family transcriptional regulator [Nocardia donostiensis]
MPKKVDPIARRAEILDAAVRVFARKGFAASRIEDVAAEAGIAKGSVYLTFDSRDALLTGVFDAYNDRAAHVLTELGAGSGLDRLAELIRRTVAMLDAHPDHARVLLDVWAAKPPMDIAAVYREYRNVIADLLRQSRDEGELRPGIGDEHAAVIVGAIEGCLLQSLADADMPLAALAEPIVRICVDGVRR